LPHRGTIGGVYVRGASLSIGTAPRASQARFVPSSTFLTSSTVYSSTDVAGLFHPAATSGLRSSGVSPRKKPYRLVACRCPLVVCAGSLPPSFIQWAPPTSIRLQGLHSSCESVANRGGLDLDPPAPLLSFSFLGFFFANLESTFTLSPAMAFLSLRRVEDPRPALLLRARLPVQGS